LIIDLDFVIVIWNNIGLRGSKGHGRCVVNGRDDFLLAKKGVFV
jgi:hypothetical protein